MGVYMAVPKRKTTPSRRGMRRSHDAMRVTNVNVCSNCGSNCLSHVVCKSCGCYKGRQIVSVTSLSADS